MSSRRSLLARILTCLAVACSFAAVAPAANETPALRSSWVYPGDDGRLVYKTTPQGDRIMDFSHAGYRGGGVPLPDVPVRETVRPSGAADDTDAIQAAIDRVSALPQREGFRGAVLLAAGTFTCSRPLQLATSGVVLRGSGSAEGGTTIRMTGPRHTAIVIGPARSGPPAAVPAGAHTTLADTYVPSGGTRIRVADANGLTVGDTIALRRPITAAWVELMQMHTLRRDGQPQTWIGQNRQNVTERKIVAIAGNALTLDVPLSDSLDASYLNPPGTSVSKISPAAAVTEVGVERLRLQCPPLEVAYGEAPYAGIRIAGHDCWVRDVFCEETMNTIVLTGRRITLQRVGIHHTFPNLGASKPTDFSLEGSQILIDRCHVTGDNEYFVWTSSLIPGPNVVLNSTFRGRGSRIQPHQRWATGLLIDNCTVPDGGIDFPNRGVAGSGHGWTMGWGVVWNSIASTYVIQNPPGAINWAIGCIGTRVQTARYFDTGPLLPEGEFDAHGTPVAPASLYLAQLAERLGPDALRSLGYAANAPEQFTNKSVPCLPALPTEHDPVLGPDLALHRPVNTSDVRRSKRAREFGGERALDANPATYWATNDGIARATCDIDTEGPLLVNAIVLEEPAGVSGRVRRYKLEAQVDSDWRLLGESTTIGARQVHRFPAVTLWKVRLTVLEVEGFAAIRKFGVYAAPEPRNGGTGRAGTQ